jgi:hypothetical protein
MLGPLARGRFLPAWNSHSSTRRISSIRRGARPTAPQAAHCRNPRTSPTQRCVGRERRAPRTAADAEEVRRATDPELAAELERTSSAWSGWGDSNSRPPAPKAGALTKLRYTPDGAATLLTRARKLAGGRTPGHKAMAPLAVDGGASHRRAPMSRPTAANASSSWPTCRSRRRSVLFVLVITATTSA